MRRVLAVGLTFALSACGGAAAPPTATAAPSPTASPRATPAQFQITPSPPPSAASTPATTPRPAASARPITYVAMGASDTVGVGAADPATGSWPSQLAARLPGGSRYVNLGVSGSLATQAQTQQLPRVVAERPDAVTVWLAVNDLNAPVDPDRYRLAMTSILDALVRDTQAFIFVGNVPDLRGVPAYAGQDPAGLLVRINAYNARLDGLAKERFGRVFLVDLFSGSAEIMSGVTVASDGFHPSTAGYARIADRFAAAMRDRGLSVAP